MNKTSNYLYGVNPKLFKDLLYKDALQFKVECCDLLLMGLMEVNYKDRDDYRIYRIMKARKFNEALITELLDDSQLVFDKTSKYLYGVTPKEFANLLYTEALYFKVECCDKLLKELTDVPFRDRDVYRVHKIMKARDFNEYLLSELKESSSEI